MIPVLVLGGGDVGIGVLEALAASGRDATLLHYKAQDHARHSRFASSRRVVPAPGTEPEALLRRLMEAKEEWDGSLILPADDDSLTFVAKHRDALRPRYLPSVEGWDLVSRLVDKKLLCEQARKVGVPIPLVGFPESAEEVDRIAGEIDYPAILKPRDTQAFFRRYQQKLFVVENAEELGERLADARNDDLEVLLSEIIPGPDDALFHYRTYLDGEGQVLAELCTQKLRQYPRGFGVASYSRTVPILPELREHTLRILRSIPYRGFASAEFKRDDRDGSFKLMEINARNVLTERLFLECGINFPEIQYRDRSGMTPLPAPGYPDERYWVHNLYELKRLVHTRDLSLADFLQPYRNGAIRCCPLFADPLPILYRCGSFARNRLEHLIRGRAA